MKISDSIVVAWGDGEKATWPLQQKEKEERKKGKEIWEEREKRKEVTAIREMA